MPRRQRRCGGGAGVGGRQRSHGEAPRPARACSVFSRSRRPARPFPVDDHGDDYGSRGPPAFPFQHFSVSASPACVLPRARPPAHARAHRAPQGRHLAGPADRAGPARVGPRVSLESVEPAGCSDTYSLSPVPCVTPRPDRSSNARTAASGASSSLFSATLAINSTIIPFRDDSNRNSLGADRVRYPVVTWIGRGPAKRKRKGEWP